jgi:hypothetical protein
LDVPKRAWSARDRRLRKTWSYTGTWTHVAGETVIDGQLAANRFLEWDRRLGLKRYSPAGIGLPSYMQDFCLARDPKAACQLPQMTIAGYQTFGSNSGVLNQSTNYQAR